MALAVAEKKRQSAYRNRATAIVIVVLVLLAGSLATFVVMRKRPPPQDAMPIDLSTLPGSKFEVTYQPETVVIDPATVQKSFEGVSADGAVFVFNTTAPAIRGLRAGTVMLLQGLALKKVAAIENHGQSVIIATTPATLTDAIRDGHIQWDVPITFDAAGNIANLITAPSSPPRSSSVSWDGSLGVMALVTPWSFAPPPMPVALIASPGGGSGSEGNWKFTTKATKEAGQLNLDVNIKGDVEGLKVDVTGKGHIQSFGLMADIQIHHGVVEQFKYVAKNLRGDVTIDFIATKTGDGELKGLETKLPYPFETPLPIGGIPFVLSIGEAVIIKPALSKKNEMAEGHFKITYGGGQGFSLSGASMGAEGQPEGENEITSSTSLAIAPFAYIVGFAMPRIELTLGLAKATGFDKLEKKIPPAIAERVADLLSKTTIGAAFVDVVKKSIKSEGAAHVEMVIVASHLESGPLVIVPCKKTTLDVHANVGYDANVLGATAAGSKDMDLSSKQVIQQTPPNVRCGN